MRSVCKSASLLAILSLATLSLGQAAPKPATPTPSPFEKKQIADLLEQLKSNDPGRIAKAKTEIRATIGSSKLAGVKALVADFLPPLVAAKKYDIVEDLASFGIVTVPYSPETVKLAFDQRIKGALANNKPADALKYSRSLYNVTIMKDTAAAMVQVANCLKAAFPDKPELVERFKQEQTRGTASTGSVAPDAAPSAVDTILKTIPADESAYLAAADTIPSNNKMLHLSRGNLLLMASRAAEARMEFEAGLALSDEYRTRYEEGIARAIKAEDGLVGRANAYMLTVKKAPAPSQNLP